MSAIPTEKPTPAGGRPTIETIDERDVFGEAADPDALSGEAPRENDPSSDQQGRDPPRDDQLRDDVWGNPRSSGARPLLSPLLAGIEVTLSVEIGSHRLPLRDLMALDPGQIFALDRMTAEPVSVLVNGRPFARGEVVAMGDRFGVRIVELLGGGGEA